MVYPTVLFSGISLLLLFFSTSIAAEDMNEDILRNLPEAERAIKNEVDHWGLPFSDQLRRFIKGRESFRKEIGEKAPQNFFIGIQHGLDKVPLNKYWFKGSYTARVELEAARNEYENFQVAVLSDIGKSLKAVILVSGDLSQAGGKGIIPSSLVKIYRVGYVKTVPARYPVLYNGLWPDYLLPNAPLEIGGTDLGLFWVEVKVPPEAKPGDYRGELMLEANGERVPVELRLHVYNFMLPDRVPFPVAAWTNPKWPWGEDMSAADYRSLAAEFLSHGVDPVSLGKAFFSIKEKNFSVLDENLEFAFTRGLQVFEIPRAAPDELRPLLDHLREKGWLDKALVYSIQDEPDSEQFRTKNIPFYQEMHAVFPDLHIYLASEYHPGVDRGCDIWMTDLSTGRGPEFASKNRGSAELWFYYCHLPIHIDYFRPLVQAPNMLIDNEAVEHRLALWLAWKYETRGMFIWAGNWDWVAEGIDRRDWETKGWTLSDSPSQFPYAGIHNGNGYLIYPGPSPSIRLKVLRDGLEDYGYLLELKKRSAKIADKNLKGQAEKFLAVPESVLMDAHYFNRDPSALLKARSAMARLIEALGE